MTKTIRKYSSGELAFFAAFEQHKDDLPQGDNAASRQLAVDWLKTNGIATKRVESYHYSDLRKQFSKKQNYANSAANISFDDVKSHPTIAAFDDSQYAPVVFVDGKLRLDLSDISAVVDKINVSSLAELTASNKLPASLATNFAKDDNQNAIDNLTRVMWRDGLVLSVKQDIAEDLPIFMIFVTTGQNDQAQFNRHYIMLEQNVKATIIEAHINLNDAPSLNLHHFNYNLDAKSNLTHFVVNGENKSATNICRTDGVYADKVILNSTALS
ncbi:MAG: hypothetical protein HRU28_18305, partial [Rhizobiales bacterium]|nr:hypothetical protein [Hyphomicrobiales bacterium]